MVTILVKISFKMLNGEFTDSLITKDDERYLYGGKQKFKSENIKFVIIELKDQDIGHFERHLRRMAKSLKCPTQQR